MNYRDSELRTKLANEYVLGTLRYSAAKRFEGLMQGDESLRELVTELQSNLAPLIELLPPEKPNTQVWNHIEQQLFERSPTKLTQSVNTDLKASNDWKNTFFKTWAMAASLALIIVSWQPWSIDSSDQVSPTVNVDEPIALSYAAVLNSTDTQQAAWLLTISPQSRHITASSIAPQPLGDDKVFELWVKTPQSELVQSLGIISSDGKQILLINDRLASSIGESEFFGVSVEQPGGSITGQPTTTPTYVGALIKI